MTPYVDPFSLFIKLDMPLLSKLQSFTTFNTVLRYTVPLNYLMLNAILCSPLSFELLFLTFKYSTK